MKCPLCKAPTDVKATRIEDGLTTRTRECFNLHIFKTIETVITQPKLKKVYKKFSFDTRKDDDK
jgi:transcriptional regulator NrdR family protein